MKRPKTTRGLDIHDYLSEIGRRGGTKSRRELTNTQARQMVAIREAKRAALRAGLPLAEINSWRLRIDPAIPRVRRQLPQIKRRSFPSYAKLFPAAS
jgi:hypothetical protein